MASTNDAVDSRWIAVLGFALVFVQTVILFRTPPATVYELSIYDALPWPFWVLLCGTLFLGFVVIVRSTYNDNGHWRYGLLLVTAVISLLVFLPYFRGYPMFGRADPLSHIGFIRDVQKTGTIRDENIYPNFHALVLTLAYATGLKPMTVITAVPGIASIFSVVSSAALIARVYNRVQGLVSLPFVAVLVTAHAVPWWVGTLTVPFVLYLFVKERQSNALSVRAALAIVLVGMVIYHPLSSLLFLSILAIYQFARSLHRTDLAGFAPGQIYDHVGSGPSAHLLFAVVAIWYYQFAKVRVRFASAIRTVIDPGGGKSDLDSYSSTVSEYSPALIDLARIGLLRYGKEMILLTAGGLYAVLFAVTAVRDRVERNVYQTTFVGAFGLFSFLSALFLVADFPIGPRPFAYANLFGALLTGALFYKLFSVNDHTYAAKVALYVILAALVVISTFGLYASTYDAKRNHQVTEKELEGSEWFLEHRNEDASFSEFGINTYRFRDALYGRYTHSEDKVVSTQPSPIPPHFNYTEYDTLGASYDETRYVLLPRAGRIFYPKMYPDYRDFWKFTPADFDRLQRDPTVAHVYTNGGSDAYLVNATASE